MNWRQAKNLLLVSFLLLDLVLAWLYLDLRADARGQVAGSHLDADLLEQLAANNITLAAELSRSVPELALLQVGLKRQNPYSLAATFFGTLDGVDTSPPDDPLLAAAFRRGEEELLFYRSGVTVYTNSGLGAGDGQTEAEAQQRAEEFLGRHSGDDLHLLSVEPYRRQGTYMVEFCQSWEGQPLVGASGAVLVVTPAGVEHCWRRQLTVFGESGIRRSVIPAEAALLTLALERPRPQATPLTVKGITLGYYNEIYNADQWEAAPVWQIWAGGDINFYINAYTGELEAE